MHYKQLTTVKIIISKVQHGIFYLNGFYKNWTTDHQGRYTLFIIHHYDEIKANFLFRDPRQSFVNCYFKLFQLRYRQLNFLFSLFYLLQKLEESCENSFP